MRDLIARVLAWALAVLTPKQPGRHTADFLSAPPEPAAVSPWSRPWTSPTKEEAQAIFQRQAEATMELGIIRERRRAAALAALGVDYPYTYDGAPFPRSAFISAEAAI